MNEYIISANWLEIIQKQAWHAGHSNVEPNGFCAWAERSE